VLAFLSSTMIGIGYLTLPVTCKAVGIITALFTITISGICSLYAGYLIIRANHLKKYKSYPKLVKKVLGKFHFYFINFNLLLYVLFSCTIYIYFGNELVIEIF